MSDLAKVPREAVEEKFQSIVEDLRIAQRKLSALQSANLATLIPELIGGAKQINSVLVASKFIGDVSSVEDIRQLAVSLRDKFGQKPAVAAIFAAVDSKPMLVIAVNQAAQDKGIHAGNLVKTASSVLGGGGGGKADIAQGGGQDLAKVDEALAAIKTSLSE
jgi:alanyl-tRNA synthetase